MTTAHSISENAAELPSPSGVVTLLTDFGTADVYVAEMKGVLLSRAPNLTLVDLTHRIEPQNIRQGALALAAGWQAFPTGTVHVGVVDPQVGSDRAIIVAYCHGHFFLAPNNGLLTQVIRASESVATYRVTCTDRFRHPVSPTFHGRDIMAPIAAHLASTGDLPAVGPRFGQDQLVLLDFSQARVQGRRVIGEVVAVDGFGNAITNITEHQVQALGEPTGAAMVCHVGAHPAVPMASAYVNVPDRTPVAVVGSNGCVEIAVNGGSAAQQLGCKPGDPVQVVSETS